MALRGALTVVLGPRGHSGELSMVHCQSLTSKPERHSRIQCFGGQHHGREGTEKSPAVLRWCILAGMHGFGCFASFVMSVQFQTGSG